MSVLLIAGSPSERSRTAALLEGAGQRLETRGVQVNRLRVRDLNPQALLLADFGHPSVLAAQALVANASVLVVAMQRCVHWSNFSRTRSRYWARCLCRNTSNFACTNDTGLATRSMTWSRIRSSM